MGMTSNLLVADSGTHEGRNRLVNFSDRDEAWEFIKLRRDDELKLRIDLTSEDGYSFEYRDGSEIMVDRTVDDMDQLYHDWRSQMPPVADILNLLMQELTNPDFYSDENVVEELMSDIYSDLEKIGLYGTDAKVTRDLLEDLARDMYNYLSYALTESRLVSDLVVWEFLHVKAAHIENGKLYITARIYVEGLRDLDYMDERSDVDFVEIVDEIWKLFIKSDETRARREDYRRNGSGRLARELLS